MNNEILSMLQSGKSAEEITAAYIAEVKRINAAYEAEKLRARKTKSVENILTSLKAYYNEFFPTYDITTLLSSTDALIETLDAMPSLTELVASIEDIVMGIPEELTPENLEKQHIDNFLNSIVR